VVTLYLALNWLIVERLTLPGVLPGVAGLAAYGIATAVIQRVLDTATDNA